MKSRNLNRKELENAIAKVNRDLATLQEVKRLLLRDGISPDEQDKAKESKLIQKLMGYEKDLARFQHKDKGASAGQGKAPGKHQKAKAKVPSRKPTKSST